MLWPPRQRRQGELLRQRAAARRRSSGWSISTGSIPGAMRFSVGAVDVCTGNFTYFDTTTHKIGPSTSWPRARCRPAFRRPRSSDEYFWDGGLVSNTPLQWVLDSRPRRDTLAFQIDLWNARGMLPQRHDRGRSAAEGDRLFKPQSQRDRSVSEDAEASHRAGARLSRSFRPNSRTARTSSSWRRKPTTRSATSCI